MKKNSKIVLGIVVLFVLISLSSLVSLYTDWVWFGSIGYLDVFSKILGVKVLLFFVGFLGFFGVVYLNLWLSKKYFGKTEFDGALKLGGAGIGVLVGFSLVGNWDTVLLFFNQVGFDLSEPIFGNNVGFYVFSLPFYNLVKGVLVWLVVLSLFFVGAKLFASIGEGEIVGEEVGEDEVGRREVGGSDFEEVLNNLPNGFVSHISGLFAVLFGLLALHFYLDRFGILYSNLGFVYGAGYTDVHVVLPVISIMMVFSGLIAIVFAYNIWNKSFRVVPILIILVLIVGLVGGFVAPSVVQNLQVQPNELELEEQYISNNIEFTRHAYALDDVVTQKFAADTNITPKEIENNRKTVNNIRLWDYRVLKTTYEQLQEIRLYYTFNDVDVDRYTFNESDGYRQVMLSVREMDVDKLPPQADTWVNNHLIYTHGYGVVMSPVNKKTSEGAPQYLLKDVPSSGILNISRSEIYYGTLDYSYAVANTDRQEFDYPLGETNVYTSYKGDGGIKLNSIKKIAYSYRFGAINLFLTNYINENSKLMIHRNIRDRVENIAPFLELDKDPYAVVENGKVYWVIDAYTTTNDYPYSKQLGNHNYIRNSVKVVINAYNGDVSFYIADEDDPIIQTWKNVFPNMFQSLEEMPNNLKQHIRYPEDYFSQQMQIYKEYHMTNSTVFYNQEDLWQIPKEKYAGSRQPVEPYYVSISLPETNKTEFILIQPFTPSNRDNMIAWLGARSDDPNYGELLSYEFSKGSLIYGPSQIEARIDQDPTISQQLTLWDQRGSRVIRGNLLVIPLNDSLLYVEPVFIQSDESSIPELRRVIVSNGDNVIMAETLEKGINQLVGKGEEPGDGIGDVETNIQEALKNYYKAIQAQKQGNWSSYGEYLEKLEKALENLNASIAPGVE